MFGDFFEDKSQKVLGFSLLVVVIICISLAVVLKRMEVKTKGITREQEKREVNLKEGQTILKNAQGEEIRLSPACFQLMMPFENIVISVKAHGMDPQPFLKLLDLNFDTQVNQADFDLFLKTKNQDGPWCKQIFESIRPYL